MTSSALLRDTLWNVPFWAALMAILAGSSDVGSAAEPPTGAAILQQLRSFATMGSVLYLAAHPDDENTQAITYLARGRGYRTAYLSLTRGDGGQNLLGPQLGEALGVARTQELLAARRVDGGRQYFTRAKDFGYSKNSEETLSVWDRQTVLGDIVRVIRAFRPDVIITRFSPDPAPTHGHHTASAVLAVEAFRLAADPAAFPEQLGTLRPWQARRIVHNVGPGGAEIARSIDEVIARFNVQDATAGVPALLAIRRRLAALPTDPLVSDKREQLDRIIQACLGLEVDTVVDRAEVVPGEDLKLRHTAVVRSRIPVRWTAVRYPSAHRVINKAIALRPNQPVIRETSQVLPATAPPSQPYWLRTAGTAGMFDVDDASLIGRAENPATFPLEYVFDVGGQTLVIAGEPMPAADHATPTLRRRLTVIAPVSLRFIAGVPLFAPGAARPVTVEVTAARARAAGTVQLDAPAGWTVTPASQPFRLAAPGDDARFTFTVTAPAHLATAPVDASVKINGRRV